MLQLSVTLFAWPLQTESRFQEMVMTDPTVFSREVPSSSMYIYLPVILAVFLGQDS